MKKVSGIFLLRGGLKKDPKDERDYPYTSITDLNIKDMRSTCLKSAYPSFIDHTEKMSSVKYQGDLGSCVAFSVCALKEWQELIEYETKKKDSGYNYSKDGEYDLSEQWIYWNAKKIDPWPNEEGTNFRSALKVLNKIGVPVEKGWQYKDTLSDIGKPEPWANLIARWFLVGSYWRVIGLSGLKQALLDGPVVIGIECFEEIYGKLVGGVIPMPSIAKSISQHAICAVGYDDSKKLIKFKNSWSKFFGSRGYGYLSYDYIDNYMLDAWATRDIRVKRDMMSGKFVLEK